MLDQCQGIGPDPVGTFLKAHIAVQVGIEWVTALRRRPGLRGIGVSFRDPGGGEPTSATAGKALRERKIDRGG
jgi:hypothetical protein